MKLIGKGAFTKAYLTDDGKVLLNSCCPIKECMAHGWFPSSYLFPTLECGNDCEVYIMDYYPKVRSIKNNVSARQYRLYKALRALECHQGLNNHDSYCYWIGQFKSLHSEFKVERQLLLDALDACANYGSDIAFEISPRNIAVKNNKLVLLDCFFSISKLREVRGA